MTAKAPVKLFMLRAVLCLCGLAAVGMIVGVGLATIYGGPHLDRQVVATTPSPDGHLKAVLMRISGHAKTGYVVDVNAAAGDTARVANVPAVSDENSTPVGLDMVWKDNHTLELHVPHGTVARLEPGDATVGGVPLTVTLQPQI